jgi:glucose/arabinose dehydrogenase
MNLRFSTVGLLAGICILVLSTGCRIAPLRVVSQPNPSLNAPEELPKIVPPNPSAAEVPAGYRVDVAVSGLTYPSSVEFDNDGAMFVAEAGYVYGDEAAPARILRISKSGETTVLADQLSAPITDLLWHEGKLFISQKGKISVLEGSTVRDLVTGLPSKGDHHNNQIIVGPDGKLYVGQGTASNSGVVGIDNYVFGWLRNDRDFHDVPARDIELDKKRFTSLNPLELSSTKEKLLANTGPFQRFGDSGTTHIQGAVKANGTILRCNLDGSGLEVFAWGLRNPFGLAFGPDGQLYAADNGYDDRGSRPVGNAPDVIWRVKQGAWYGWPDYVGGIPITDPEFKPTIGAKPEFIMKNHPPVEQPIARLTPHVGVTKMEFSRNSQFGFEGQMFVGEVGDMEPVTGKGQRPVGFEVVRVDPRTGQATAFFRAKRETLGKEYMEYVTTPGPKRPVDVKFSRDGDALYVADIGAILLYPTPAPMPHPYPGSGVIWRITREGTQPQSPINITLVPGKAGRATDAQGSPSRESQSDAGKEKPLRNQQNGEQK